MPVEDRGAAVLIDPYTADVCTEDPGLRDRIYRAAEAEAERVIAAIRSPLQGITAVSTMRRLPLLDREEWVQRAIAVWQALPQAARGAA